MNCTLDLEALKSCHFIAKKYFVEIVNLKNWPLATKIGFRGERRDVFGLFRHCASQGFCLLRRIKSHHLPQPWRRLPDRYEIIESVIIDGRGGVWTVSKRRGERANRIKLYAFLSKWVFADSGSVGHWGFTSSIICLPLFSRYPAGDNSTVLLRAQLFAVFLR